MLKLRQDTEAMTLEAIELRSGGKKDMLDVLDETTQRVNDAEVRSLIVIEIAADRNKNTYFRRSGGLTFAELIGHLEIAKSSLVKETEVGE